MGAMSETAQTEAHGEMVPASGPDIRNASSVPGSLDAFDHPLESHRTRQSGHHAGFPRMAARSHSHALVSAWQPPVRKAESRVSVFAARRA